MLEDVSRSEHKVSGFRMKPLKNINNIYRIWSSLKAAGLRKGTNVGLFCKRMLFAQCLVQNVQILTKLSCHSFF